MKNKKSRKNMKFFRNIFYPKIKIYIKMNKVEEE